MPSLSIEMTAALVLLVALSLVNKGLGLVLGEVGCSSTPQSLKCPMNDICSMTCKYSCYQSQETIWGTSNFTYDSSVCLCAYHDLRITRNGTSRYVELVRTKDIKRYLGSIRFGIQTTKYGELGYSAEGSYYFVSPRITETILDITSVHRNFMFLENQTHFLECHRVDHGRPLSVRLYLPTSLTNNFVPVITVKHRDGHQWSETEVPARTWSRLKTGGFWCEDNSTLLSAALSIAMRADADFFPEFPTITGSIGDSITIRMIRQNHRRGSAYSWKKDEQDIDGNRPEMSFPSLQVGDMGMYSFEYKVNGDTYSRRGVTRLIVRVCPQGIYGPSCQYVCPDCQNGGMCHDLTGICICPPGFKGPQCNKTCGDDRYGRDCTETCSLTNPDSSPTCKSVLFCLPDPYGCSCGTGFKGPFCNTSCAPGEYGANCLQKRLCHCNESDHCDVFTGNCPDGCLSGWHGTYCNVSFPVLTEAPTVESISSHWAVVKFRTWTAELDFGEGSVVSYIVQLKRRDVEDDQWTVITVTRTDVTHISVDANKSGSFSVNISGLQPETRYGLRVAVQDVTGGIQWAAIPEMDFMTLCGTPEQPPTELEVEKANSTTVKIRWKMPPPNTWQCSNVKVRVWCQTTTGIIINETSQEDSFTFQSPPFTSWTILAATETSDGQLSNLSESLQVTTDEAAPSQVSEFLVHVDSPKFLNLSWEKPEQENGIIRSYGIRYFQTGWKHYCTLLPSRVSYDLNVTDLNDLNIAIPVRPSATYSVFVRAFTILPGRAVSKEVFTPEDVPDSAPTVATNVSTSSRINITLMAPPCNESNGNIVNYTIKIRGLDPWDQQTKDDFTKIPNILMHNLPPHTRYEVMVAAATHAGVSKNWTVFNVTTAGAVPPAPSDLTVYHSTMNSLSVSWKPPYPPHGVLFKYEVNWKGPGEDKSKWVYSYDNCPDIHKKDHHCYTITGLKPQVTYEIKVSAFNRGFTTGSDRATCIGETREFVPDAPENVTILNRTETSLTVAWQPPYRTNGNLTAYRVNATAVDSFNSTMIGTLVTTVIKPNGDEKCVVTGLYPSTTYNITVEASTRVGFGEAAETQEATRNEVPSAIVTPSKVSIGTTTVELSLLPVEYGGGPIGGYYVVVGNSFGAHTAENLSEVFATDYHTYERNGLQYYTAAELDPYDVTIHGINFTVGDGNSYGDYYNVPLKPGKKYRIMMGLVSVFRDEAKYGCVHVIDVKTLSLGPSAARITSIIFGTLLLLVILTFIIIVIIAYRVPSAMAFFRTRHKRMKMIYFPGKSDRNSLTESTDCLDIELELECALEAQSHLINVSDLENCIHKMVQNGTLKQQYVSLGKGQLHTWLEGTRPENKLKNRYGNLLPYDHSRVMLQKINNDIFSDYINANYVDGYKSPKRYIATQGPKPQTIVDFWRMVWQVGCSKIIMATNIMEGGKCKCELYWSENTTEYGEFTISLTDKDVYADFVIRRLSLRKRDESREIQHFHFTTWPDHGVPMYPVAVVNFLKKVGSYQTNQKAPVIIHCSAGVGRTGTLLLIDAMMEMGKQEGRVDVLGHLYLARQQRINLVETLDQYIFVHNALMEALCGEETSIPCPLFFTHFKEMKMKDAVNGRTRLDSQFERLKKLCPPLRPIECTAANQPDNQNKNRFKSIIPSDRARAILKVTAEGKESDYINAVYVNGYRQKDAFVVTQLPLPNTVGDFWRLVHCTSSCTVVLLNDLDLNDQTCPVYWQENSAFLLGDLSIEHVSSECVGDTVIRTFLLQKDKQENRTVKQFHLGGWSRHQEVPPHPETIINLMDKVERWQQQSGNHKVVVQCYDGAKACGVFCATMFTCDKIKCEQDVDVFLAIRTVRSNRPQFVDSMEQFLFCHEEAATYLDSFETYANFQ